MSKFEGFPLEEPPAEVRVGAKALRQMYVGLVNEGFTREEAMQIVGYAMLGMLHQGGGSGE